MMKQKIVMQEQSVGDGSRNAKPLVQKAAVSLLVPVFTDKPLMIGNELARVAFCSDPCWCY